MKRINWISILVVGLFSVVISCEKNGEDSDISFEQVTGLIQKGPYINGTQILMSALNAKMNQTGDIFSTEITNDIGSFEIKNVILSSRFVDFSAAGYYYNEITGQISDSPLTLFALSDLKSRASLI